jgi:hypothetical protein
MAVYYATKAYVLSFTEALSRELSPQGVRVTVLCPGPVATEFQARAGVSVKAPPWLLGQTAEQVAEAGYRGFMAGKRLVIPGFANKVVSFLPRLVPRGFVVATMASYQNQRNRKSDGWQRRPPKP